MNEAVFLTSVKQCKKILTEFDIFKKENLKKTKVCTYKKYSNEFRKSAQKNNYGQTFIVGLQMDDYDFLLTDGSYFQFSFDREGKEFILRLAYYPTIKDVSYSDFLEEIIGIDIDICGGEFMEEYQQYLSEQEVRFVSPIRYDYNVKLYKRIIHSASHLHLGYEENLRIPVNKILSPSAFVKIVLQYYYYDKWKTKIDDLICFIQKNEVETIKNDFYMDEDMQVPYITWKEKNALPFV